MQSGWEVASAPPRTVQAPYDSRFNSAGCSVAIDQPAQHGPGPATIFGAATLSCGEPVRDDGRKVGLTFLRVCLQYAAPTFWNPIPLPFWPDPIPGTCRQRAQWGDAPNRVGTSWTARSCYPPVHARFRLKVTTAVRFLSPGTGTLAPGPVTSQTFTGPEATLCWQ